jgi:hypothetical protein
MKQLALIGVMIVATQVAFSQNKVDKDPSYSANNYKHPNKAAYAKEHNLDNSVFLETSTVIQTENYKQPYNKTVSSNKPSLAVNAVDKKSTKSYKHPYGL